MKMSMPGQDPSMKTAPAGAVSGNSLQARLLLGRVPGRLCGRLRCGLRDEVLVVDGLTALDDGDRREFPASKGEDGHFGVLAVAFFVERDPARRACEVDLKRRPQ